MPFKPGQEPGLFPWQLLRAEALIQAGRLAEAAATMDQAELRLRERALTPLLISLVFITGVGGPVSAIGFSVARDYNGPAIVGTATGVVNVGGFVGPYVVGYVKETTQSFTSGMLVLAGTLVIAGFLALRIKE